MNRKEEKDRISLEDFDLFLKEHFRTEGREEIERYKKQILPLIRITQLFKACFIPNATSEQI